MSPYSTVTHGTVVLSLGSGGAHEATRVHRFTRQRSHVAGCCGAQQPAMPVIGVLAGPSAGAIRNQIDAFNDGLKQTGFVEGQNLTIEYRWANGQYEKLPAMAVDLVGRQVAAILALAPAAALAAKATTATIPVVFVIGGDPVARD